MTAYLVDTNVLFRFVRPDDGDYAIVQAVSNAFGFQVTTFSTRRSAAIFSSETFSHREQ